MTFAATITTSANTTATSPSNSTTQIFSDVSTTNRNNVAIDYLANNKIISGYPDGTFQPDKPVSRVEFLKLALLSSNIKLNVTTPTNFKDIDENAWYAPYVREAKQKGWVEGYPDGTFKPEQSVNKVEGLKMIAAIQGWNLPSTYQVAFKDTPVTQWYAPYVAYAKRHNFLEETSDYFIPSGNLSRAKTSEILFRTLVTIETKTPIYSADLINKMPERLSFSIPTSASPSTNNNETSSSANAQLNFTPVKYATESKISFDNITLNDDFPNTFYLNEIYSFKGKINSGRYADAFVFLQNDIDETFENVSDQIQNGSFDIPVIFRKPGNYKLGVIPGNIRQSKYVEISVLPSLPNPQIMDSSQTNSSSSTIPTNVHAQYLNQKTTFSWNNGTDNLAEITFTQGNLTKTFFSRQNLKSWNAIYNDFQNFQQGQITLKVSSARAIQTKPLSIVSSWVSSTPQTISVTQHTFSETHPDETTYNTLPEIMAAPAKITFSGKALEDIYQDAEVIRPDGKVDKFPLQTSSPTSAYFGLNIIDTGGNYSFNYNAATNGTYILEINGKNGLATINTPVFIGEGIPLIPDFFDLVNADAPDTASNNILTNKLLNLINQDRTKAAVSSVKADQPLNTLAQNYADEMATQNFFGHVDPSGKTPDDRRLAAGITTEVGENLASAPNLLYAHNGLMRSATHRMNIIDADWTRVGIGLAKTSDGYLLVVEEFSTDALDAATLSNLKTNMLDQINQKRQSNGVGVLINDQTLGSIAENWSSLMASQKFFDITAPDGSSLVQNIQKAITNHPVQIYILESQHQNDLLNDIFSSTQTTSAIWNSIGIGLDPDNDGAFKLTLLLST